MTHANIRRNKNKDTGFKCPQCGSFAHVLDSRPSGYGWRRRRGCINGHRFSTHEGTLEPGKSYIEEPAAARRILLRAKEAMLELQIFLERAHEYEELEQAATRPYVAQDGEIYPGPIPDSPEHDLCASDFPSPRGMD